MKSRLLYSVFSFFVTVACANASYAKRATNLGTYGYADINIKGRIQLDAVTFDSDNASLDGNADVRRARISIFGDINEEWRYVFDNSFVNRYWDVEKAFLGYKPLNSQWEFVFGQQFVPSSLEHLESGLNITFLERAPVVDALARGLRGGASAKYVADNWSFHAGIYDERWGQVSVDDEGWEVASRVTYLPLGYDRNILHFGASFAREFTDEDSTARFRARPESRLTNSFRSVDTGTLSNVKYTDKIGLEFITQWDLFTLQGEVIGARVERDNGAGDVNFDGWYAELGYLLTGEQRIYQPARGHLNGIKPTKANCFSGGGIGAWQIAARYSALDVSDDAIRGGEMNNLTLGINWYPEQRWRVMLNQSFIDTDEDAVVPNDNPKVTSLRIQYVF